MSTLFTNARLFTAESEDIIDRGALLVEDGSVRFAGNAEDLKSSTHHVIDLGGKFLMPGMTETHAHLSFDDSSPFSIGDSSVEQATITAVGNARLMLNAGFTSAVSFGSTYAIDVALRNAINTGKIRGPRLMAAGRDLGATASNVDFDGGLSQIADGPWAVRKAVREQRRLGVDVVKIFIDGEAINPTNPPGELSFTNEEVIAAVDEAHRRNLKVACHARSSAAVRQAVNAGVDFIGHANYLDDETVALLVEHRERIFIGPAIAWEVQYLAQCESLGISRHTVQAQGYEAEIDATIASVEKLRAAGIKLVVGGDYGISIAPHGSYAKDLEYFVDLFSMSPAEAIICATKNGGLMLDPAGTIGTLRSGSVADFIVVDGDPLQDITVLQNLDKLDVYQAGSLVPKALD
ncbi:MAG: amidohydrolase family protein [Pseudomonadales bacterium]|nr:amidohydrolase family protein [Pseudomonadales bacterium]MDG1000649.1 amidohydrolase family protein [Pseudomonadales bacterium]MDG1303730.1 amidohydrolase family protein [Pseudomonadales bacterium]MDG1908903.1 amidohydrolase family protein [Pseudomonadales bacterium]